MNLFLHPIVPSPLGDMCLVTDEQGRVRALDFADHPEHLRRMLRQHCGMAHVLLDAPTASPVADRLKDYFDGDLRALDGMAIVTRGSELQEQVWAALRRIPPGQVLTYGELARQLGHADPRMARDVGAANAANPIAIATPCHRVIGKNGDLKGYAWGLHRKRWLLSHERAEVEVGITPQLEGFE